MSTRAIQLLTEFSQNTPRVEWEIRTDIHDFESRGPSVLIQISVGAQTIRRVVSSAELLSANVDVLLYKTGECLFILLDKSSKDYDYWMKKLREYSA